MKDIRPHAQFGRFGTFHVAHRKNSYSPDGKMLASTSENKTLKIWDVSRVRIAKE
jgi:WD40 repeat protein